VEVRSLPPLQDCLDDAAAVKSPKGIDIIYEMLNTWRSGSSSCGVCGHKVQDVHSVLNH
jgi:hypothetical protein